VSFMSKESRFPIPAEWHGVADPIKPVRHNIHRASRTAACTDEAPTHVRPRLILGKSVEPDVDPAIAAGYRFYSHGDASLLFRK